MRQVLDSVKEELLRQGKRPTKREKRLSAFAQQHLDNDHTTTVANAVRRPDSRFYGGAQNAIQILQRLLDKALTKNTLDSHRLNEARWAACNTPWIEGHVPTMEKATEVADAAIRAYLGLEPEEWEEIINAND